MVFVGVESRIGNPIKKSIETFFCFTHFPTPQAHKSMTLSNSEESSPLSPSTRINDSPRELKLLFEEGYELCLVSLPVEACRLFGRWASEAERAPGSVLLVDTITWVQFTYVAAHMQEIVENGRLGDVDAFVHPKSWNHSPPTLAPKLMDSLSQEQLGVLANTSKHLGYAVGLEDACQRLAIMVSRKTRREIAAILGIKPLPTDEPEVQPKNYVAFGRPTRASIRMDIGYSPTQVNLLFQEGEDRCVVSLPAEGYRLIRRWAHIADCEPGTIFPVASITWNQFTYIASHIQEVVDNGRLERVADFVDQSDLHRPHPASLAPEMMNSLEIPQLSVLAETSHLLGYEAGLEDATLRIAHLIEGKSADEIRDLLDIVNTLTAEEQAHIQEENAWVDRYLLGCD